MVRELRLWNLEREQSTEVPCFLCLLLTPDSLAPLGSDINGKTARGIAVSEVEWAALCCLGSCLGASCEDAGGKGGGFC